MRVAVAFLVITLLAALAAIILPVTATLAIAALSLALPICAIIFISDANQKNELNAREKMFNTNISMLGKVKSTLFGSTAQHSPTKLDDSLKDIPEPIVAKPLLFTCC